MDNLKNQFLGFINTPSLFKQWQDLTQFELDIESMKTHDFSGLHIPENLPLGKRIEHFFKFYIQHSPQFDLIKHNIQIIKDKHTLGELDFILYDKNKKKYMHVEHVYKYYLYDDSFENAIDRFIGPNRDDTFALKLQKLQNKQLPLLYKEESQAYLDGLDTNNMTQQVCFKGNIYVPLHLLNKELPIVNNACIKGFYINQKAFFEQQQFKSYEYYIPSRQDWVSDAKDNDTWQSFDEIKAQIELFLNHEKSTLIWLRDKDKNQVKSFFVTWW